MQMILPPLYEEEEDSNDGSQNWPNLTYPVHNFSRQHGIVCNTFITISTARVDLTQDVVESVVFNRLNETNRSRSSKN